ncbi:MAG: hypothetical protein K2I47_02600, partial [Odoribacter sp.]|nr:hypothetical protein [Odoribacter sp.]
MKKLFYIIILCSLQLPLVAQTRPINRDNNLSREGIAPQSDSTRTVTEDIPHHRKSWKWMKEGVYKTEVPVDTTLDGLHNYN